MTRASRFSDGRVNCECWRSREGQVDWPVKLCCRVMFILFSCAQYSVEPLRNNDSCCREHRYLLSKVASWFEIQYSGASLELRLLPTDFLISFHLSSIELYVEALSVNLDEKLNSFSLIVPLAPSSRNLTLKNCQLRSEKFATNCTLQLDESNPKLR